jgi:hypothetical protein
MADRNRTVWKLKIGIYEAAEWGEVTVDNGDTVTIGSLVATENPYYVTIRKMVDGSEMACTYIAGTNVVSITGAGPEVRCIYMAYGIKA